MLRRCGESIARQIADNCVLARISPSPAKAVVEKQEWFVRFEFEKRFGLERGPGLKNGLDTNAAFDRLGIMRGNYAAGECRVCEILAVSIEFGIG